MKHHYIPLLKNELAKMKKNFPNCYLKGSCPNPIRDGPFRGFPRMEGKGPAAENLSDKSCNNSTWYTYNLPKEDLKMYKSHETPLQFC